MIVRLLISFFFAFELAFATRLAAASACAEWWRRPPNISLTFRRHVSSRTICVRANVRYWHEADIPTTPAFVRYWGTTDNGGRWG